MLDNWPKPLKSLAFRVTGIHSASHLLTRLRSENPGNHQFLTQLFARNRFDITVTGEDKLPSEGGYLIVSNHPHGFFDGLAAIWLGSKDGGDCRAIARHFLSVFEPIKDLFLLIKLDQQRRSAQGEAIRKQASEFVANGGRIAIMGAGRLSIAKPFWAKAKDLPWKTGPVRIAQAAQAPIVLVNIEMPDSSIRQLSQRIHPIVRALLQTWAYLLGKSQRIELSVISVIQPQEIPQISPRQQTQWLQKQLTKPENS